MGVCSSKPNRLFDENRCNSLIRRNCDSLNESNQSLYLEISLIVIGFIREIISKFNMYYKLNNLPSSIKHLCKLYFGCIHGDLIIEKNEIFRLNDLETKIFEYNSILIKKNATLT
eukprot:79476_1